MLHSAGYCKFVSLYFPNPENALGEKKKNNHQKKKTKKTQEEEEFWGRNVQ